ncbi:MAG: IclR family transcriptional regulator [Deltaproteobacteria bacterium]|nr:IclR family transcriptional regulator [Deltaproteobacteria bacterium]
MVERALDILECFSAEKAERGITEIAADLKIYKSRAFRLVKTLEGRGFLWQNPETGRYRLGLKLLGLSHLVEQELGWRQRVRPILEDLSLKTGGTTTLRVMENLEIHTIDVVESSDILKVAYPIGTRMPFSYGSHGLVLSAALPEPAVRQAIRERGLRRYTSRTITAPTRFLERLRAVRRQGYAFCDEGVTIGVRSVAVPVRNREGEVVASVGVSLPKARFPMERLVEVVRLAKQAAEALSAGVGHRITAGGTA